MDRLSGRLACVVLPVPVVKTLIVSAGAPHVIFFPRDQAAEALAGATQHADQDDVKTIFTLILLPGEQLLAVAAAIRFKVS